MKVAVFGANGQLGTDVVAAARQAGHEVMACMRPDIDITKPMSLQQVAGWQPELVINTAAFTNVNACETEARLAHKVNGEGAGNVARVAVEADARMVHISTDYVFAGDKPGHSGPTTPATAYTIDDEPSPVNEYGRSKLAGEEAVLAAHEEAAIVRISSVFGKAGARGKGGNFIETILERLRDGLPVKVVDDQWMTPTWVGAVAPDLLDSSLHSGLFHMSSRDACTWHELAAYAAACAGLPSPGVQSLGDVVGPRRPTNSSLHCEQRLGCWRAMVDDYSESCGEQKPNSPAGVKL